MKNKKEQIREFDETFRANVKEYKRTGNGAFLLGVNTLFSDALDIAERRGLEKVVRVYREKAKEYERDSLNVTAKLMIDVEEIALELLKDIK